ncbi:MAG: hypothetical protein DSZ06_02000 [Sulfurospirillum sp.]|nr:MAG: hypothetical protein DSZ06_02000 [Sulfurospirillum sp.]
MILYDQDHNFIGISKETVNFLGYEDIEEFISLHSDFADLLVPIEGKIYNFKNLSWLDFILYSGAPNKDATITRKDGSKVDIKLTVKELMLVKDFTGMKKCYAARIISEDFVKIARQVDSDMKTHPTQNVSLSSLLTEENVLKENVEENKQTVQSEFEKEIGTNSKKSLEDDDKPLLFDFQDQATLEDENRPEEIVLDFSGDVKKKEESSNEVDLSFLKTEIDSSISSEDTQNSTQTNLDQLLSTEEEPKIQEPKVEEESPQNILKQKTQETSPLDFLQSSDENENRQTPTAFTEPKADESKKINRFEDDLIIQKPKVEEEPPLSFLKQEEPTTSSLDFLKKADENENKDVLTDLLAPKENVEVNTLNEESTQIQKVENTLNEESIQVPKVENSFNEDLSFIKNEKSNSTQEEIINNSIAQQEHLAHQTDQQTKVQINQDETFIRKVVNSEEETKESVIAQIKNDLNEIDNSNDNGEQKAQVKQEFVQSGSFIRRVYNEEVF